MVSYEKYGNIDGGRMVIKSVFGEFLDSEIRVIFWWVVEILKNDYINVGFWI